MDVKLGVPAVLLLAALYLSTAVGMPYFITQTTRYIACNHSKFKCIVTSVDLFTSMHVHFCTTAAEVHRIPRNIDTSGDVGSTNSCTPYVIVQRDGRDGIPGRDGLPGSPGVAGQKGEQGPPGPQGKKSQDFHSCILQTATTYFTLHN